MFFTGSAQKLVFDPKNENVLVPPPQVAASNKVSTIHVELYMVLLTSVCMYVCMYVRPRALI